MGAPPSLAGAWAWALGTHVTLLATSLHNARNVTNRKMLGGCAHPHIGQRSHDLHSAHRPSLQPRDRLSNLSSSSNPLGLGSPDISGPHPVRSPALGGGECPARPCSFLSQAGPGGDRRRPAGRRYNGPIREARDEPGRRAASSLSATSRRTSGRVIGSLRATSHAFGLSSRLSSRVSETV